jgi:hypothetical protein
MKKRQKKLKSDAEVEALLDGDMSDFSVSPRALREMV